jgi:hypothetical protein|tara:strand:+ start:1109 stop:1282 length:174 start_codon:yes stop_codon:yes gene_type:complete
MTPRDLFAAQAMQKYVNISFGIQESDETIARRAFEIAEAMMQERKKHVHKDRTTSTP